MKKISFLSVEANLDLTSIKVNPKSFEIQGNLNYLVNLFNIVNREMGAKYVIFDARMLSNVKQESKSFSFRAGFLPWIKDDFWKQWRLIFWWTTISGFFISLVYNFTKASKEF